MIIQHARDMLAMLTAGGVKIAMPCIRRHVNLNSQNFIALKHMHMKTLISTQCIYINGTT